MAEPNAVFNIVCLDHKHYFVGKANIVLQILMYVYVNSIVVIEHKRNIRYFHFLYSSIEISHSARAQSVTANATGCEFDPHTKEMKSLFISF